jgi:hypothetical protein
MDANTKATQEMMEAKMKETMKRQIGSLISIMEADRDEMKQEIRAGKEHMQEAVMCRKT